MVRYLFCMLFLLGSLIPNWAKEYSYTHYTADDGLPSTEVYHIMQDSKGYVWFATDMGVSRFDGYYFHNFNSVDGLPDNTVFEIYEDYEGRIWFVSYSSKLSYYSNDSIYEYKYNNKIKDVIGEVPGSYAKQSFFVDSSDCMYLSSCSFGTIIIDSSGVMNTEFYKNCKDSIFVLHGELDRCFFARPSMETRRNTTSLFSHKVLENQTFLRLTILSKDKKKCISSAGNQLVVREDGSDSVITLPHEVIGLNALNSDTLFIGTHHNGLYLYSLKERKIISHLFENKGVSFMIQDDQGGFWISFLNNGVYYIPGLAIENYPLNGNLVNALKAIDNTLYVGQTGGHFYSFNEEGLSETIYSSDNEEQINDFSINREKKLLIGTNKNLFEISQINANNLFPDNQRDYMLSVRKILRLNNDTVLLGLHDGLHMVSNGEVVYKSQEEGCSYRVECLFYDTPNSLLIGTLDGLLKFNIKLKKHEPFSVPLINKQRVLKIDSRNGYYFFATKGAGLIISDGENSHQFTVKDGLPSNFVNTFCWDKNQLWIGTNHGISRLEFKNDFSEIIKLINITKQNGLIHNEVMTIEKCGDYIFAGTKKGLSKIVIELYKENLFPPPVYITQLEKDHKTVDIDSVLIVSKKDKSFSISFTGLSYRSAGKLNYLYKLEGEESNWVETKSRVVQFSSMVSGDYRFLVKAINEDNVVSSQPAVIKIKVLPYFWQEWWFLIVVSALFIYVLYSLFQNRVKEVKSKGKQELDMLELKQHSLRQQMNPHFIFNTLNSIQYYVLDKDTKSSHKYLSMFAKLMRFTLDNSRYSNIMLKNEIQALELYLELEILRFDDKISYTIVIENDDLMYNKIPTLILQPFVENAIWHGLMHKDKPGHILIRIEEKNQNLHCFIEDDGVGRNNNTLEKSIHNKPHKSLGTTILKERLGLLNSIYKDDFRVLYYDLKNEFGEACGTKVEIILPIIE